VNDDHVVLEGFSETTHANPLTRLVQAVSTLAVGLQRQLGAKSPFASYMHAATSSVDKGEHAITEAGDTRIRNTETRRRCVEFASRQYFDSLDGDTQIRTTMRHDDYLLGLPVGEAHTVFW
jgi:hypothetical protein